jgi:hypothetical protein
LQELRSARVDYVDTSRWQNSDRRITAAKQNLPLVYGDRELGSKNWMEYRDEREAEDRRRAEREAEGRMDEL